MENFRLDSRRIHRENSLHLGYSYIKFFWQLSFCFANASVYARFSFINQSDHCRNRRKWIENCRTWPGNIGTELQRFTCLSIEINQKMTIWRRSSFLIKISNELRFVYCQAICSTSHGDLNKTTSGVLRLIVRDHLLWWKYLFDKKAMHVFMSSSNGDLEFFFLVDFFSRVIKSK